VPRAANGQIREIRIPYESLRDPRSVEDPRPVDQEESARSATRGKSRQPRGIRL